MLDFFISLILPDALFLIPPEPLQKKKDEQMENSSPNPPLRAGNQPRQGESETPDKLLRPAEFILLVLIIWILLEIVSNFVQQTSQNFSTTMNNYKRKFFHILCTTPFVIMGFLLDIYLSRGTFLIIVFILLVAILSVEIPRLSNKRINDMLLSKFSFMYKEHERNNIVSSIWGPLNLFYMIPLMSKPAIVTMLCVGCWSDPLAAIFGMRFGGNKNKTGRTWAGSIAHFGFSFVFLYISSYIVPFSVNILVLLVIAILGSFTERYCTSKKYFFLDDNFIVPLVIGIGMEIALR